MQHSRSCHGSCSLPRCRPHLPMCAQRTVVERSLPGRHMCAPAHGLPDVSQLLASYHWLLPTPSTPITLLKLNRVATAVGAPAGRVDADPQLYVIRDDLLPMGLASGNKARKLDAVLPHLIQNGITDIVTCGGLQSAHSSAVPAAANMLTHGALRVHVCVRGERPTVPTGDCRWNCKHTRKSTAHVHDAYRT
eukprot:353182-Chlamydomonas_euryale.AAC.31